MINNHTSTFGLPSLSGRMASACAFITLLAFFLGPFYWPATNAAWAGFLRFTVFISVVMYCISGGPKLRWDALSGMLIVLLLYIVFNSLVLGESQSIRRAFFIALFVFMVANFWREPVLPIYLLGIVAIIGVIFSAFSLLNLYRLGELEFSYRGSLVYFSGQPGIADFGNTIVAAMHYAACYCAGLWMLIKSKNGWSRIGWTLCIAIIAVYIVLTFARTGWAACLIASMVLFFMAIRSNRCRNILPAALTIAGLLAWFAYKYLGYEVGVRGVTYRDEIWITVLEQVKEHLVWGHGGGAKIQPITTSLGQTVNTAHSTYLEVLYQFGLVGMFLIVAVLSTALRSLLRSSLSSNNAGQAAFGLALLASATFVMLVELSGLVDSPNLLWIWFWLPLGIALSLQRGKADAEN